MTLFPTDPKQIRSRIRSYERALKKEYDLYGAYDDGTGKRYLLGSLYLLLSDIEGALKHYVWFEKSFGNDIGDPLDLLTWTLVLYRAGDLEAALRKLRQAMLSNLYLIPHVLRIDQPELDIAHLSNLETREYLEYIPDELVRLWDEEALDWLRASYHQAEIHVVRERYVAIQRQLKDEPRGEKRTNLVHEAFALRNGE